MDPATWVVLATGAALAGGVAVWFGWAFEGPGATHTWRQAGSQLGLGPGIEGEGQLFGAPVAVRREKFTGPDALHVQVGDFPDDVRATLKRMSRGPMPHERTGDADFDALVKLAGRMDLWLVALDDPTRRALAAALDAGASLDGGRMRWTYNTRFTESADTFVGVVQHMARVAASLAAAREDLHLLLERFGSEPHPAVREVLLRRLASTELAPEACRLALDDPDTHVRVLAIAYVDDTSLLRTALASDRMDVRLAGFLRLLDRGDLTRAELLTAVDDPLLRSAASSALRDDGVEGGGLALAGGDGGGLSEVDGGGLTAAEE